MDDSARGIANAALTLHSDLLKALVRAEQAEPGLVPRAEGMPGTYKKD